MKVDREQRCGVLSTGHSAFYICLQCQNVLIFQLANHKRSEVSASEIANWLHLGRRRVVKTHAIKIAEAHNSLGPPTYLSCYKALPDANLMRRRTPRTKLWSETVGLRDVIVLSVLSPSGLVGDLSLLSKTQILASRCSLCRHSGTQSVSLTFVKSPCLESSRRPRSGHFHSHVVFLLYPSRH